MGKLNLVRGEWTGKVGTFVGAKWKKDATLRSYQPKVKDPKTEAQQKIRTTFGKMASYLSLFTEQLQYISSMNTSGMTVRNALIKLNKKQIEDDSFNAKTLLVNKGGLQKPSNGAVTATTSSVKFTWTKPTATNITAKAKMVCIVANETDILGYVQTASVTEEELTIPVDITTLADTNYYMYILDYRGSAKVGSVSVSVTAS